jgi:hypothetical protein
LYSSISEFRRKIMTCIDPVSFFAELGMNEYNMQDIPRTIGTYISERGACSLLIRLHGEESAKKYEVSWCGNGFLVVRPEGGDVLMVPTSAIISVAPNPAEPFPLFKSMYRKEPVNLLTDGLAPQSPTWTTVGAATSDPIPGIGQFAKPVRFDAQADWNRRGLPTPVLETRLHEISILVSGTCSRICVYLTGPGECAVRGPIGGSLHIQTSDVGQVEQIGWEELDNGFKRLTLHWTPTNAVVHRIAVGDDGSAGHLDLYGVGLAMIG